MPTTTCARCRGRVLLAHAEDGERDDACLTCGWRPGGPTAEQAAALIHDRNIPTPGKSRRGQGPRRAGGKL